jgi:hypothetical protein
LGHKESGFAQDAAGGDALRGLSVFIDFLRRIGFSEQVRREMPVHLKSPNAIDPSETYMAFLIAVAAGNSSLRQGNRLLAFAHGAEASRKAPRVFMHPHRPFAHQISAKIAKAPAHPLR